MASVVPPHTAKLFQNITGDSSNCTTAATTTMQTGRKSFPGKPYLSNRRSLNVSRTDAISKDGGNLLLANADLFYNRRAIGNNEYMSTTMNSSFATATTRPNHIVNSNSINNRTSSCKNNKMTSNGNNNILLCTSSPPSETRPKSNSQWNGA